MAAPRTLVPVLALVAMLAACSSNGSVTGSPVTAASTPSTSSTSSSPTPPSSSASSASDGDAPSKSTLQAIVVQQSDLPSGWTAKAPAAQTNSDQDTTAEIEQCIGGATNVDQDKIDQVQSDDFTSGETTISSQVTSYMSQSDVLALESQLQSAKAQPCLNSIFRKVVDASLHPGVSLKQIGIKLTLGSGGGPSNLIGFANGGVTFTYKSKTYREYLGEAFFSGRQLAGDLTATSFQKPIDATLANRVVVAVAQRAQSA